jgi:hypothetical protein
MPHFNCYIGDYNKLENLKNFYKNNKSENLTLYFGELNSVTVDWIKNHDFENIHYFLNGDLNFSLINAKYDTSWYHAYDVLKIYKNNEFLLQKINQESKKEFYFDALLGCLQSWDSFNDQSYIKQNRQFIINFINKENLLNSFILTYLKEYQDSLNLKKQDEFIFEPEIQFIDDISLSADEVLYFNQKTVLCYIVPISIYNKCSYSLIAETNYENEYSFFTEKTVKPILGKRLFIAFCGQYFLRNLKNLGFKTFDNVIDESYDNIEDSQERWELAAQQILYLITQDQEKIAKEIKDIVEHNYNLLISKDWMPHKKFLNILT